MRPQTHPEKAGAHIIFLPSTDVIATEAEGQMRNEWGACHNIMCSHEIWGRRGMSVGGGAGAGGL